MIRVCSRESAASRNIVRKNYKTAAVLINSINILKTQKLYTKVNSKRRKVIPEGYDVDHPICQLILAQPLTCVD